MGEEEPPLVHFVLHMQTASTGVFSLRVNADLAAIINGRFSQTFQTEWLPFDYTTSEHEGRTIVTVNPTNNTVVADAIDAEAGVEIIPDMQTLVERIPGLGEMKFKLGENALSTTFRDLPCRLVEYVPGTAIDFDADDDYAYNADDFGNFGL